MNFYRAGETKFRIRNRGVVACGTPVLELGQIIIRWEGGCPNRFVSLCLLSVLQRLGTVVLPLWFSVRKDSYFNIIRYASSMKYLIGFIIGISIGWGVATFVPYKLSEKRQVATPAPIAQTMVVDSNLKPFIEGSALDLEPDVPTETIELKPVNDLAENLVISNKYLDKLNITVLEGRGGSLSEEFVEIFGVSEAQRDYFNATKHRLLN